MRTKERPQCRRQIIKLQLQPAAVFDRFPQGLCARPLNDGEAWDGWAAMAPNRRKTTGEYDPVFLSDGMKKQMRKMFEEGFWKHAEAVAEK